MLGENDPDTFWSMVLPGLGKWSCGGTWPDLQAHRRHSGSSGVVLSMVRQWRHGGAAVAAWRVKVFLDHGRSVLQPVSDISTQPWSLELTGKLDHFEAHAVVWLSPFDFSKDASGISSSVAVASSSPSAVAPAGLDGLTVPVSGCKALLKDKPASVPAAAALRGCSGISAGVLLEVLRASEPDLDCTLDAYDLVVHRINQFVKGILQNVIIAAATQRCAGDARLTDDSFFTDEQVQSCFDEGGLREMTKTSTYMTSNVD